MLWYLQHPGVYWCQQCKMMAEHTHDMAQHLQSEEHQCMAATLNHTVPMIVIKRVLVACGHCNMQFALKVELVQHLKKYHGLHTPPEPTFCCDLCPYTSAKPRAFQVSNICVSHNKPILITLHAPESCAWQLTCMVCCMFSASCDQQAFARRSQGSVLLWGM